MEVKFRGITSNFTLNFDQECASHVYGNFINETQQVPSIEYVPKIFGFLTPFPFVSNFTIVCLKNWPNFLTPSRGGCT